MKFWKMNGAGNDFILLDLRSSSVSIEDMPVVARCLCERHLSIGADGLMAILPSSRADLKMLFFNSDGSLGEMCGNGARCICRYAYENGLSGEEQVIETTAGIVTGRRITERLYRVRLNDPSVLESRPVEVNGKVYDCWYVELGAPGIPHAVVQIENLTEVPERELFELGRELRYHPAFPKGANVNFYELLGEDRVLERTWERGVEGFTYACGTGTGSTVAVLTLRGLVSGSNVRVDMPGGTLYIDVAHTGSRVDDLYLTGPTNIVAKGEIWDEDLSVRL